MTMRVAKNGLVAAACVMSLLGTSAADARTRHHVYRGKNYSYYQNCKKSSGTTGLIAGGAGGALVGHALGGGTVGTVLGAAGGAVLGRHLDKRHDAAQNRRNGC